MTEKQFVADNVYVMQDGEVYVVCDGEHNADVVTTALNELLDENEKLKEQNEHLLNIIGCLEKGSCRSIDSFLDSYCTDELLNEYGLNEDDLFYGDFE